MLSPATMLFENELFYTSFISMLLLLAMYFLIELQFSKSWISASGVFVAITLLCLTKSLYHLAWLLLAVGVLLVSFYKTPAFSKVLVTSLCSVVILTGWYAKNLVLFGSFSASSWTGMNLARIVFHDEEVKDSSSISSIPPFYPISYYKGHLPSVNLERYAGWNDKVLMDETRNGSFHNLNHAGYLQVSNKYMEAGLDYIREHPSTYLRHVATSVIIFFTPASSYFRVQANNRKIWLYDLVYSFNLSHFAGSEQDRQLSLAISAIPKFLVYLVVFTLLLKRVARSRHISAVDAFAAITILFVLTVSSCFEYGENMRFRYEVEPLFLVLAAQVLAAKIKPVVH
jgi:hypothetical protein